MKRNTYISLFILPVIIFIFTLNVQPSGFWKKPFDTTAANLESTDSVLTLDDVLNKVAVGNPVFQSFDFILKAANNNFDQAGLRSNPELEFEFDEVGWDAPGFKESEFTVSLAQEFEFFGQRDARKKVAKAEIVATKLEIQLSVFDLYLKTKYRFYTLAHAQQNITLSQASLELAEEIVENITDKLDRGAALQSELLLAQLEEQRSQLALDQAKQDVMAIEATLVSLWDGNPSGLKVSTISEYDFSKLLDRVTSSLNRIDSTRVVAQMVNEFGILQAEKRLVIAEAKPAITLRGGFKRFEIDNSKSFLFGVSLPIPLFNRNQGTRQSLDAELRALDYEIEQSKKETKAAIQSHTIRFNQLIDKHAILDSLLLPTAEKAYHTLQKAYEAGRVSYTELLEAERSLNDLSFEHNDILLAIQEQIIALERISGIVLRGDKEN